MNKAAAQLAEVLDRVSAFRSSPYYNREALQVIVLLNGNPIDTRKRCVVEYCISERWIYVAKVVDGKMVKRNGIVPVQKLSGAVSVIPATYPIQVET